MCVVCGIYLRMCRTYACTNDRAYNVNTFKKILMTPYTIYAYIFKGIHLYTSRHTSAYTYTYVVMNIYIDT